MTDAAQDTERSGSSNIRSLFTVVFFVFMAIVLISIAGTADDSDAGSTFTVDGISYETTSNCEARVVSDSYTGIVVIPSSVENGGITYSVTSIHYNAFSECTSLTSVVIPDSVTSLHGSVFSGCTSLTEINVSSSNMTYSSENGVLFNKDKATLIRYPIGKSGVYTIPDSVTYVGDRAFSECTSLTSITIPNSITYIGGFAFYGCTSLISVTIPNSVITIVFAAFCGCTSLTSVTIPNSVTSIGAEVFSYCTSLTEINVSSSNMTYSSENGVLFNKDKATLIRYPIGKSGVYTIPDSVTYIGGSAFSECTSLTSVVIPDSVTSIYKSAFSGCTSLTEINVSSDNMAYSSENGVLFNKDKATLIRYPIGKSGAYMIPNSITSIGDSAFSECTSLTSITIPNSITSIGDSAFSECTSLTSITIPNSITSIGDYAFSECTSLTEINFNAVNCSNLTTSSNVFNNAGTSSTGINVIFSNAVTKIPAYLFCATSSSYAPKVTSVTIGSSVKSIGYDVFSECSQLKYLNIQGCKLTMCNTVLDKGMISISIRNGSSGYSGMLSNYTFCNSDGTIIHKTMLAGYIYEANTEGTMVRTGSAEDPPSPTPEPIPEPTPSDSNNGGDITPIIGIVVGVILMIVIAAIAFFILKKKSA